MSVKDSYFTIQEIRNDFLNIGPIIIHEVKPAIEKAGLKLVSISPILCVFKHNDESVSMSIELLHMPKINKSDLSTLIRVSYSVKYGVFHEIVSPDCLRTLGKNGLSRAMCNSMDEAEQTLKQFVRQAIDFVIPYLYQVEYTAVAPTEDFYRCLSGQIDVRCDNFMKTCQPCADSPLGKIKEIEKILVSLQPEDLWDRKDAFFDNQEMLLSMATYLGQIILHYTGGHWTESSSYRFRYFVINASGREYDPLWMILNAWNFYPEVTTNSLVTQLHRFFLELDKLKTKNSPSN